MRIGVSSYSFSQAMRDGRMTILDVIPTAKGMGYEGVEIVKFCSDEEMREYAPKLAAQSKEFEMPIIAYMVGADFLANGVAAQVETLKKEVEIAATLGAHRMRHDATGGKDATGKAYTWEEALPILAEGYGRVTEYAMGLGINTMIENHGYFAQDAARVKSLIEAVGNRNFGWLVDMGNFLCADEDPAVSCGKAAPYAFYVHAKDFIVKSGNGISPGGAFFRTRASNYLRGTVLGHGNVPVLQCLQALKDGGYDGYVSIEFEGMEDCIEALSLGVENLKRYLSLLQ